MTQIKTRIEELKKEIFDAIFYIELLLIGGAVGFIIGVKG